MTTLCTVTVTDGANDTKAQEVQRVKRSLTLAADKISKHGGSVTSGGILDDGGVSLGTWTLTGTASK
jgi:hypothetical protein